jgi:hypothetical protein
VPALSRILPVQIGHWYPTGAGVISSGQIGLPQLEHVTRVGRSVWMKQTS